MKISKDKIKTIILLLAFAGILVWGGVLVFSDKEGKLDEPQAEKTNDNKKENKTNKDDKKDKDKDNDKDKDDEDKKDDDKKKEEDKKSENSNSSSNKNNGTSVSGGSNIAANNNGTSSNSAVSNPSSPNTSSEPERPSVPVNPVTPVVPSPEPTPEPEPTPNPGPTPVEPEPEPTPVLVDAEINKDMLTNNTYTLSGEYKNVTIASDVLDNAVINLDNVQIAEKLILRKANKFALNIAGNSNINTVEIRPVATFALRRSVYSSIAKVNQNNTTIDGPTITFNDKAQVNTIDIYTDVQINGEEKIASVNVYSGKEIVLNIETDNLNIVGAKTDSTVAINKNIANVNNNSANMNLVVNASVNNLTNAVKAQNTNIRINNSNVVSSLTNDATNTVVSGGGKISNLNINAQNTFVYSEVENDPIVSSDITDIIVRNEKNIYLTNVYSESQSSVTFEFNEDVPNLTINDISVICNAGKVISTFNLTKINDKKYKLSTSYFKNPSYELYVTLPNGNIISKEFNTDYSLPRVNNAIVTRESAASASLELQGLDEGGILYYLVTPSEDTLAKTYEDIKASNKFSSVKVGYNKIALDALLEENKEYNLYYFIEGFYDNKAPVMQSTIDSSFAQVDDETLQITEAKEEVKNRFVIRFNKPLPNLSLTDFNIICPGGSPLTLTAASLTASGDGLMYVIVVPDNYAHLDGGYTAEVNTGEEILKKNFEVHFNPPVITKENVERTKDNKAIFTFSSDELGTVYYGLYEYNGAIYDYNSSTPFATDILLGKFEGKTLASDGIMSLGKTDLINGNRLEINLNGLPITKNTQIWALFVDEKGNYRLGFADHFAIPEATIEEETKPVNIVSTEATNKVYTLTFDKPIKTIDNPANITITGTDNDTSYTKRLIEITYNDDRTVLSLSYVEDITLNPGNYKIEIPVILDDNTLYYAIGYFEVK